MPSGNERQTRSDELLHSARMALAKGDAQRAGILAAQAKQLGLTYPLHADSPDKVEALVRKAAAFAQGPTTGRRCRTPTHATLRSS